MRRLPEEIRRVTVMIGQEKYVLKTDMSDERLERLSNMVNSRLEQVAASKIRIPASRAAVLVALQLADDYMKLEEDHQLLLQLVAEARDTAR